MMKKKPLRKGHAIAKDTEFNAIFVELRAEYLASFDEKLDTIRKFWETGNRDGLHNEFHKMKGTGTTYGLPEVSEVAELLEYMCEHNSEKLGMGVVIGIDLLQKICQSNKLQLDFDLYAETLFKRLQSLYEATEHAS